MTRHGFFLTLCVLFLAAAGARHALERVSLPSAPPASPQRIVSLSPGITETLYALGLGSSVAGVTRWCAWPPETASLPRVAGFGEINYEAVLRVKPDLVVLPADRAREKALLEGLGLPVLALDTLSLSGLLQGITLLGRTAGRETEAEQLKSALETSLTAARAVAGNSPRPKTLFAVMRADQGAGKITGLHCVGRDGFYSELIEAAGGQNAYTGTLPFPRLSRESLIVLDPEVIIELIPKGADPEAARRDWQALSSIRAVKNGRVFIWTEQAHTVPGPRFADTLALLSQALHPETRHGVAPDRPSDDPDQGRPGATP
jgi:iron complex transport system substrate-binding protein